jgi:thioredoxin-related protein
MKHWSALIMIFAAVTMVACSPGTDEFWFVGSLDDAVAEANERDTLVFVEFNTEWCSWCRRLEAETLTDRDVRRELAGMIALQLDAEKEGLDAARRFGIESYPTMIFLDSEGEEVERIVGYLPPDKFLSEVQRIRTGDTLYACLQRLREDPTNIEAINRVVEGLLERSDPEGAIAKIKKFHSQDDHSHETCRELMFLAGRDLHYRVYLRAAKLYREGWETTVDVPSIPGSNRLSSLLDEGFIGLEADRQAELMRNARFEDAAELLEMVDLDRADGEDLFAVAAFAFRGGHYELAGDLYSRWFEDLETPHTADMLNRAAWQLYLARESLETAVAMARQAFSLDPSADITDTLARLLYVTGSRSEAVELEKKAADLSNGGREEQYRDAVKKMKAGIDLGDRPAFETYPGTRETSL